MAIDDLKVKITADTRGITRSVDDVNRRLGRLGTNSERAFKKFTGAAQTATKVTAGLGAVIGSLGAVKIAQVGAEFESLQISLNNVFGGMEGGKQAMDDILQFAQSTPFQIETVTKAFIALKSAGLEPNRKQLQIFADTASTSVDQLGVFEALVRVTQRTVGGGLGLEELNMIMDRGVDVLGILKDELGLRKKDIQEFGETAEGAARIMEVLTKALGERFGGAMEAQMNSLTIQLDNMTISFKQAAVEIFNSGFGQEIKNLVLLTTQAVNSFTRARRIARGEGTGQDLAKEMLDVDLALGIKQKALENTTRKSNRQRIAAEIAALKKRRGVLQTQFDQNKGQNMLDLGIDKTAIEAMGISTPKEKTIEKDPNLMTDDNLKFFSEFESLVSASTDPLDKLAEQMRQVEALRGKVDKDGGLIASDETIKQVMEHLSELETELKAVENVMGQAMTDAITSASMAFTDDLVQGIMDGKSALGSFKDFAKSIVSQIITTFIKMKIVTPILNAAFGAMGMPKLSGAAGGGRASFGQPMLVGERGPELFVPNQHGRIMNNADSRSAMGGSGVVINQSINFSTGIVPTVRAEVSKMMPQIADVTRSAVMESAQRGGQFRKGLAGVNG